MTNRSCTRTGSLQCRGMLDFKLTFRGIPGKCGSQLEQGAIDQAFLSFFVAKAAAASATSLGFSPARLASSVIFSNRRKASSSRSSVVAGSVTS